jgi:hypothetical protein
MSAPDEVVQSVALIIWGGEFDPRDVTRGLGMRPNQSWHRGDHKSYRGPDGVVRHFTSRHEWSGWKKWSTDRGIRVSLERQLRRWVTRLGPKTAALRGLRRRGISMELNCCLVASGSVRTQLPPDLVAGIGRLGLGLEITWYADERRVIKQAASASEPVTRRD